MKTLKLWAGLLTLFFSGVVIGAIGTWGIAEHRAVENYAERKSNVPRIITKRLTRELDLNQNQRERIEKIVCRTHLEIQEIKMRHKPEKDQAIQQSIELIRAELLPEQQKKLDALHEKMTRQRAERERRRDHRGTQELCD